MKRFPLGLDITEQEKKENERKARKALLNELKQEKEGKLFAPVAKTKDWRVDGGVTPVKDQGGCGSCGAFATVATMEGRYKVKTGTEKDLSEWYLFNKAGGGCYFGSSFPGLLSAAKMGTPSEECCPYLISPIQICPNYQDTLITASSTKEIRTNNQAKSWIASKGPIMTGMEVYADFFSVDSEEVYKHTSGDFQGNHAICIVGFDQQGWIVKNSWGTWWGNQGFCKIGYNQCGIGSMFPFYGIEM